MDNRQFYIKEFDNNYYYNFKSDYRFFKFIEIYVRTRIFDMKIFKANMDTIINTIDKQKLPSYKRLLTQEYWKMNDDEFLNVIQDIFEEVKQGKIPLIDIVKIFMYFNYFIKKGLISYDIKTLKSVFSNGMNISSLTSSYCPNVDEELNQIAIGETNQDVEDILRHFNNLNNQLKDKLYTEKAEKIFACIPERMEEFYDKFDKECMNIPIFKYYEPFQFFQRISCAANEDIVTIKEKMSNRVTLYQKELELEIKNLKQLKQIVDDYTKNKENSIKVVMLREFSKELGNILEKYRVPLFGTKKEETLNEVN